MNLEINYNSTQVCSIVENSVILATEEKYLADDISVKVLNISFYNNTLVAKKPTNTSVILEYTGSVITNGYKCPVGVSYTGLSSGITGGTYTAVYTPDENCTWEDGTTSSITVTLTIVQTTIYVGPKPTNPNPVTYDKSEHTNGYTTPTGVTMTGNNKGTNANTYYAYYTPQSGYAWDDNTQDTVTIALTINVRSLTIPSLTNTTKNYIVNTSQSPTISNFNSSYENLTGTTSAINGGNYTIYWDLKDTINTKWSDGTTTQKSGSWLIQYVWNKWNAVRVYYYDTQSISSAPLGTKMESFYPGKRIQNPPIDPYTAQNQLIEPKGMTMGSSIPSTISTYPYVVSNNDLKTIYYCTSASISGNSLLVSGTSYTIMFTFGKGETSYGTVTSTSISAYPENGTPDNTYWYIKAW